MTVLDLVTFEDSILEYIQNYFPSYLGTLDEPGEYTSDFLDLDAHRKNVTVFFDFSRYNFDELSNMSRDEDVELHIYFVIRGNTKSNLKTLCRQYATAFYNFFYDDGDDDDSPEIDAYCNRSFDGLCDTGIISSMAFYDAAEGSPNIKICDLTLELKVED